MADQVAQVKQRTDIVAVVGSRVELKKAGKYYKGLCPFHSEKTPSFFVSTELQVYKCFGCGESGDVFSFLQAYEGMTFRESLETLAEKAGVKLEQYRPTGREAEVKRLYELLNLVKEYYHYVLVSHVAGEEGRQYLSKRGIDKGMVEKFELGWAPDSWDAALRYLVGKKGFTQQEVEKAGMAIGGGRGGRYYDRFRKRVMFPLADFRGRVVGFSGRLIEEGVKEAKYVNTPETEIYHKRELLYGIEKTRSVIRKKDRVLVVEGELDVISSYKAGVMNVVGIKGSAVTEDQLRLLLRLTRNVVLCLDADVAGDEATKRGIAVAEKLGVNVEVVTVEGGKDPDEVARAKPELWKKQTKKGLGAYEFLIERAFLMHGVGTGLGKKRITEELVPVLAGIANSVERDHYVKMVAEKLGVREEVVAGEMERLGTVGRVGEDEKKEKGEGEGRGELLEKHVWGLLLSMSGERAVKRWKELGDYRWRIPGLVKMAEAMDGWIEKHNKDFRVKEFVAILPRELLGLMNQVYLAQGLVEMDEEGVEREFGESVEELVRLGVMQRMKGVSREIGELERKKELSDGDEEKLRKLQGEFSELLRSLGVEK